MWAILSDYVSEQLYHLILVHCVFHETGKKLPIRDRAYILDDSTSVDGMDVRNSVLYCHGIKHMVVSVLTLLSLMACFYFEVHIVPN